MLEVPPVPTSAVVNQPLPPTLKPQLNYHHPLKGTMTPALSLIWNYRSML